MYSKKKNKHHLSVIAADVEITGKVINSGIFQLEGTILGEVSVQSLTVGETGKVEGDITADEVIVKGHIKGTIKASKVVLERSANVIGDIFHQTIRIEEGASIQGSMTQSSDVINLDESNTHTVEEASA